MTSLAKRRKKLRLLAVGEGDLSLSLALMKAYHPRLVEYLVVTTILSSREDLLATYPHSKGIIEDLEQYYDETVVKIIFGVDAMQLHVHRDLTTNYDFDLVLFHHPHLGYDDDDYNNKTPEEGKTVPSLACRHECLIAHYLYSASLLLHMARHTDEDGPERAANHTSHHLPCIHICVCAGTIQSWKILDTVERLGLDWMWDSPVAASSPLLGYYETLFHEESNVRPTKTALSQRLQACQRKGKRRGHWLGRYGYRHQPTFPNATQFVKSNISNSYHLFLGKQRNDSDISGPNNLLECPICGRSFQDLETLTEHMERPLSVL